MLCLEFKQAWEFLPAEQRRYAYHFSKASWAGALIASHQVSYESPGIFLLLRAYFETPIEELEEDIKSKIPEVWEKWVIYASTFFANLANYQHFGYNKILPKLSSE